MTVLALSRFDPDRCQCNSCGAIVHEIDLLTAPHPFDHDNVIRGCPRCKNCDPFDRVCDVAGCLNVSSSGNPFPDGTYRWLCWTHSRSTVGDSAGPQGCAQGESA